MQGGGEEESVAACRNHIPLSLTPPSSPQGSKNSFLHLPESFLVRVCSSPLLDVTDRLNAMLTCRRMRSVVSKSWPLVSTLRIANNESDDDRINDAFVTLSIHRSASSLTSITLCLNSSINSNLCRGLKLFQYIAACHSLRELTLLLTQLSLRVLNLGLSHLCSLSLRKLALVNSVADASTMSIVAETQGQTLRSLGRTWTSIPCATMLSVCNSAMRANAGENVFALANSSMRLQFVQIGSTTPRRTTSFSFALRCPTASIVYLRLSHSRYQSVMSSWSTLLFHS